MIKKIRVVVDPKKVERRAHRIADNCGKNCGCSSNTLAGQIGYGLASC